MRIDTAATRMRVLAFLLLATAACAQTTFPAWVFQKKTSASSASVPVVISGQNNKVFGLDGSGNLSLLTNGSGSSTLAGLGDVAITGIANEDLLRYDTNESKWLNIAAETVLGAPVLALRDLADGTGALTNDGLGALSWVSYQAADAELTALAGLTSAADKLPYFTGSGTASTATVTSASRTLLSKATVGQMLEYIGAAASYNGSSIDTFSITSASPSDPASLNVNNTLGAGGVAMNFTNATGSLQLLFDNLTAARTQRFPNADGTLISTGNLTAITATGTVASGTWNGSAIGVAYGGTGSTSLTANNVLLGNGTSALQTVAPGTSGNVLTSNGTTWTSTAPAGAGHTIKEEGSGLTARAGLNFVGGGVTASDDAGNNETDVTVTRTGVYRTIWLPASAGIPRTTSGSGVGSYESTTNKINYDTLEFDSAADEFAQWIIKMPDEWNGGTVKVKVAWTGTATDTTDDVIFAVAGVSLANDDAIDGAFGTAQSVTDTLTAALDLDESAATAAITIAGAGAGEYVVLQLSRDADNASDNLSVDAMVLGITVQYLESSTEIAAW